MTESNAASQIPDDLPIPVDDGACDHLIGLTLPSGNLVATDNTQVNLAGLPGITVVYAYPRTGAPGESPTADWNAIPGARGCTPQSCSFRDHYAELQQFGARVFGLSTQPTNYQREAVERLQLPFRLLSDENLALSSGLKLPTFVYGNRILIKRLTLVIQDGLIEHVFYPVFPPDQSAQTVIDWLRSNSRDGRID